MRPPRLALLLLAATPAFASAISAPDVGANLASSAPVSIATLGPSFTIRVAADSWVQLLAQTRPNFTWNGQDLLWIAPDANGRPVFTLDQAYLYAPEHQPGRWVLLAEHPQPKPSYSSDDRYLDGQISLRRRVLTLSDALPRPHDGGSFDGGGYAIIKSANPNFGVIYEICWDEEMGNGTGLPQFHKLLYLLQDLSGRWQFLGEGPEVGTGKTGGNSNQTDSARVSVIWPEPASTEASVEIRFVCERTRDEWSVEDDPGFKPRPTFVICEDYALAGPFPAQLRQTTVRPYLVVGHGTTFDGLVELVSSWLPDNRLRSEAETMRIRQLWRTGLARQNPQLPLGAVQEGTHVLLLTSAEWK